MKKIRFLTLLGFTVIAGTLAGCGKNSGDFIIEDVTDSAINYNDNLVDTADNCITSEDAIRDTYENSDSTMEDIKNAINNTITECTTAKKRINSMGDLEGDSSLKDGIINIIDKYIEYYTKFSEMLPYIEQDEITEEENEKYLLLLSEIEALDIELKKANQELISTQEIFAKNHGFELEGNEEITNEEITDEEIIDEETIDEETTDKKITDEETSDEETIDEETSNKETSNKETSN